MTRYTLRHGARTWTVDTSVVTNPVGAPLFATRASLYAFSADHAVHLTPQHPAYGRPDTSYAFEADGFAPVDVPTDAVVATATAPTAPTATAAATGAERHARPHYPDFNYNREAVKQQAEYRVPLVGKPDLGLRFV